MRSLLTLMAATLVLASCGAVDTLRHGFQHARAVSGSLKSSVGVEPTVAFNWHNGSLQHVTVTFPRLVQEKSIAELANLTSKAVMGEFEQEPGHIVLAFDLAPGVLPQAEQ